MSDQPDEKAIQEVIALIEKLVDASRSEEERGQVFEMLERYVPHPAASDLIFWPQKELTYREMAIEMLTYRPTPLGYKP